MDTPANVPQPALQSSQDLPASPCIGVCTIDRETKMCIGCQRTVKEIGAWRTMTLDQKREVVAACEERAKQADSVSHER